MSVFTAVVCSLVLLLCVVLLSGAGEDGRCFEGVTAENCTKELLLGQ